MHVDHVVVWVSDPRTAITFYTEQVGLEPVRVEEFLAGDAPFASVRVNPVSIIDLMPKERAESVDRRSKTADSAGHPVHHVCLAMTRTEWQELDARLTLAGVDTSGRIDSRTFGAQGWAPSSFFFADPDGNVIEARYYDAAEGGGPSRKSSTAATNPELTNTL